MQAMSFGERKNHSINWDSVSLKKHLVQVWIQDFGRGSKTRSLGTETPRKIAPALRRSNCPVVPSESASALRGWVMSAEASGVTMGLQQRRAQVKRGPKGLIFKQYRARWGIGGPFLRSCGEEIWSYATGKSMRPKCFFVRRKRSNISVDSQLPEGNKLRSIL